MTDSDRSDSITDRLKALVGVESATVKEENEPYEIQLDGYPVIEYYDETGTMVVNPTAHEDAEIKGAVPIGVLEELADELEDESWPAYMRGEDVAYRCMYRLRETITGYGDPDE